MAERTSGGVRLKSLGIDDECPEGVPEHVVRSARSAGTIGAMRELIVAADLMDRGCQVFRNLSPHGIDLIAMMDGVLYPVEVTTGRRCVTGIVVQPQKARHYRFDVMAVVLPTGEVVYFDARKNRDRLPAIGWLVANLSPPRRNP